MTTSIAISQDFFQCEMKHIGYELGQKVILATEKSSVTTVNDNGTFQLSYMGELFDVIDAGKGLDGQFTVHVDIFKNGISPHLDSNGFPTGHESITLVDGMQSSTQVLDNNDIYNSKLKSVQVTCKII